ncbi:MAG: efflux RND transporter permease subunit, partial [Chloroflexota bacterium]
MVRYLIERPIAVIISFIAIVIVGLITAGLLPVSLLPEVKIPEITVYISHPNTSAIDLERTIVSGIRARLQQLPGLEDITSETRDNNAIIRLKFEYGTNTDYSFIEVNDKVDAAMAGLPREVRRPKIIKASTTDLPVFLLNLSLKGESGNNEELFDQLSNFAETVIRRRIEQLNSVAFADITGLSSPGLYIVPNTPKMQSMDVSINDLTFALDQNNTSISGIIVREGQLQYSLMFRNELRTIEDVKSLIVNVHGRPITLGELAEVGIHSQDPQGLYLSQGKRAVCMALIKSSGSKIETMRDEVKTLTTQLVNEYPEIEFETSQDQSFLLTYTIDNLKSNLIQGAFLAILILFLFIRNYRSPLLIALTLPVTLIISLFFFYLFGISINIVSLSGLILGVGMMIDNSIVVIDNIIQHKERGENQLMAITKGTNEVIAPMISSTLTSCAIFIPLIFLSGIAGALFYDQAIAIAIGQGISLLVSITLTPTLFHLVHRSEHKLNEIKFLNRFKLFELENKYESGFDFIFRHQWITMAVLLMILAGGYLAFTQIDKRQLPLLPQKETILDIDWNENIHPLENSHRIKKLLTQAGKDILQSNAFIGEQQFVLNRDLDMSAYECQLYLKASTSRNIKEVEKNLKTFLTSNYPDASFTFKAPENPFTKVFSGNEGRLTARLTGENSDTPIPLKDVQLISSEITKYTSIPSDGIPIRSQYLIRAKPDMLFNYNVDYNEVLSELRTAFNNNITSDLKAVDRYIPIIIGSEPVTMQSALNTLFISNRAGQKIPLKLLVNVELASDYRTIYGGPEGVYVPVNIDAAANKTQGIINEVENIVHKKQGIEVGFSGSYFSNRKLISEMVIIILISVLLLFFILAAQFESLTIPWVVLVELPIDIAFAAIILWLTGNSINAMSMIGFVVMGGIIINDSILKIDTINQLRREGMELIPA